MDDHPTPTLSYRSAEGDLRAVAVGDYSDVANGFLSALVAVSLGIAAVMAGLQGDRLSLVAVAAGLVVLGVGVGFGLRRARWGFLLGAGLFAVVAVGFGAVAWSVATR